jgi:2-polyprenyl-3-methyl-5-hydroxy-6-metoxy-1,4-benzoquinol methylase
VGTHGSARETAAYFHIDEELVPFIPELLADFDALGSFPETIVALLRDAALPEGSRVIDLGCGYGAVSRAIASRLGFEVTGVDMLDAFVTEARRRAEAEGVGHLCRFHCADIRDFLAEPTRYDVVLLVSVGDPLGPMDRTIGRLRERVQSGGYMIVDDGYVVDDAPRSFPGYEYLEGREQVVARLTAHGDSVVREVPVTTEETRRQNEEYTRRIAGQVRRLSRAHPEHRDAFERYLDREKRESALLEEHIACATWMLRRR